MRHRFVVPVVVLTLTGALAACSIETGGATGPSASPSWVAPAVSAPGAPSAGGSGTPRSGITPSGPATGKPVSGLMSATGFGPYAIGAAQAELASAHLIGAVTSAATGCGSARGVAKWNTPGLVFLKGKLEHVRVTSGKVRTTRSVQVGSTLAKVMAKYPGGSALVDRSGATAWYATSGDFALLFRLKKNKVAAIEAGASSTLQFTFTDGQGC
jgi:hypothetical protein